MKKLFKDFLDRIIQMLSDAVDEKIKRTPIKVTENKSIDELIFICENTVFKNNVTVKLEYHECSRYKIQLIGENGEVRYESDEHRTQKSAYQTMLLELVEKALK